MAAILNLEFSVVHQVFYNSKVNEVGNTKFEPDFSIIYLANLGFV